MTNTRNDQIDIIKNYILSSLPEPEETLSAENILRWFPREVYMRGGMDSRIVTVIRANLFINLLWRLRISRRPQRNEQENHAFPVK